MTPQQDPSSADAACTFNIGHYRRVFSISSGGAPLFQHVTQSIYSLKKHARNQRTKSFLNHIKRERGRTAQQQNHSVIQHYHYLYDSSNYRS